MPCWKTRPASTRRRSASCSSCSASGAAAASSSWEKSRPIAAPTCPTFLVAGPSRSRRPRSEACKVAGTASDDGGTADIGTLPRSAPASTTALVNSSTKSGTPSVRSTISSTTSGGNAPRLPASRRTSVAPSFAAEPVQRDHCHLRLADPRWLELGPVGCDQQHRQARDLLDSKVEHLARSRIDPMQIFEDHQYRLPPRQRLELSEQRRQCPLLLALRAEVERREALAAGKRQHLGDQREVARFRPVAEQRLQLVELCCVRVVASEPRGALQLADKGVERAVLIVRRAKIANSGVWLGLDALRQCLGQARLADARLAGDQHHPPCAELRLLPAPRQEVELLVAADQRDP